MKTPIVLALPYPAQGHVTPLMSFSQKLVENGCKVIFVNTEINHNRFVSSMMVREKDNNTLDDEPIKLVSVPDGLSPEDERTNFAKQCVGLKSRLPSILEKLIEDYGVSCMVVDLSMGWALEVANKMGIKGAFFFPASAAMFALMNNIPMLIHRGIIDSSGLPVTKRTFRLSESMALMSTETLYWSNTASDPINAKTLFDYITHCGQALTMSHWWLCNTAYDLEPAVFSFLPKILPIGPLLRTYNTNYITTSFWEEDSSCMSWLDQQPHASVVYAAFGSFALFDETQFRELAFGLELTKRPFLWVVRQDSVHNKNGSYKHEFEGSKGKIVEWGPQQKILSHPSIACFISHCGWNSTIEGLSNGVPFLCWPYFSDQVYDKMYICDELKVGLGFDSDENGLISREEIKAKVDKLLADENIRLRSRVLKKKIENNIQQGGGSSQNLNKFINYYEPNTIN
ncbi:hypothetical protein Ahy_A10g047515 isoform A [Arachis hypogaea]|uniref:EF-hand domain-containing protein n=1 Tax=Arachis hypogaea TaxID=3818 RepID=A0A445B2R8_ARAHY|nr:hypothetical protein Ahy_A10g047515 isoform A [Arachis hypogaea]